MIVRVNVRLWLGRLMALALWFFLALDLTRLGLNAFIAGVLASWAAIGLHRPWTHD